MGGARWNTHHHGALYRHDDITGYLGVATAYRLMDVNGSYACQQQHRTAWWCEPGESPVGVARCGERHISVDHLLEKIRVYVNPSQSHQHMDDSPLVVLS